MSNIERKVLSIIECNQHLSALHLQDHIWKQLLVLVSEANIKRMLEEARAKAHQAGSVTPR
ncbi:MAG: hypothetical protein DI616_15870 [Paracoccus denitrificans]|uniref:Uncharacterized protein n=1 Tax=Paracoccus denitrificans TaxID=266 RepID=A0A533I4A7_PARDE|nr:MAG: hypothetical protein DI616_15870 [Paracoccus denitrificans]